MDSTVAAPLEPGAVRVTEAGVGNYTQIVTSLGRRT